MCSKKYLLITLFILLIPLTYAETFYPSDQRSIVTGENDDFYYIKTASIGNIEYFGFSKADEGSLFIGENTIGNIWMTPVYEDSSDNEWYLCPLKELDNITYTNLGNGWELSFKDNIVTCYQYDAPGIKKYPNLDGVLVIENTNGNHKITANITFNDITPADTGFGFHFIPDKPQDLRYLYSNGNRYDMNGASGQIPVDRVIEFHDSNDLPLDHVFDWVDMPHLSTFMEINVIDTKRGLFLGTYGYGSSTNIYIDPLYTVDYSPEPASHLVGGLANFTDDNSFDFDFNVTAEVSDDDDNTTYEVFRMKIPLFTFIDNANVNRTSEVSEPDGIFTEVNHDFSTDVSLLNLTVPLYPGDQLSFYVAPKNNPDTVKIVYITNSDNTVSYANYTTGPTAGVFQWNNLTLNDSSAGGVTEFYLHDGAEASNFRTEYDFISGVSIEKAQVLVGRWSQTYDDYYNWWLRVRKTSSGAENVTVHAYINSSHINTTFVASSLLSGIGWFNINVSSLMDYETNQVNLNFTQLRFYTESPHFFSEIRLRQERNDTIPPNITNCNVNDTHVTNYGVVRLGCNVIDDIDVSLVNGSYDNTGIQFTQNDSFYYYDFTCTPDEHGYHVWNNISGFDLVNNQNSTNPNLNFTCEFVELDIGFINIDYSNFPMEGNITFIGEALEGINLEENIHHFYPWINYSFVNGTPVRDATVSMIPETIFGIHQSYFGFNPPLLHNHTHIFGDEIWGNTSVLAINFTDIFVSQYPANEEFVIVTCKNETTTGNLEIRVSQSLSWLNATPYYNISADEVSVCPVQSVFPRGAPNPPSINWNQFYTFVGCSDCAQGSGYKIPFTNRSDLPTAEANHSLKTTSGDGGWGNMLINTSMIYMHREFYNFTNFTFVFNETFGYYLDDSRIYVLEDPNIYNITGNATKNNLSTLSRTEQIETIQVLPFVEINYIQDQNNIFPNPDNLTSLVWGDINFSFSAFHPQGIDSFYINLTDSSNNVLSFNTTTKTLTWPGDLFQVPNVLYKVKVWANSSNVGNETFKELWFYVNNTPPVIYNITTETTCEGVCYFDFFLNDSEFQLIDTTDLTFTIFIPNISIVLPQDLYLLDLQPNGNHTLELDFVDILGSVAYPQVKLQITVSDGLEFNTNLSNLFSIDTSGDKVRVFEELSVGPEYGRGDTFKAVLSLQNNLGVPITGDNVTLNVYYPDNSLWTSMLMEEILDGVYIDNMTIPFVAPYGDYIVTARGDRFFISDVFQVQPWIDYIEEIIGLVQNINQTTETTADLILNINTTLNDVNNYLQNVLFFEVDSLEENITNMLVSLSEINFTLHNVSGEVDEVLNRFDGLDTNISQIQNSLSVLDIFVQGMNNSLTAEINENQEHLFILNQTLNFLNDFIFNNLSVDLNYVIDVVNDTNLTVNNIFDYLQNTIFVEIDEVEEQLIQVLQNTSAIWDQLLIIEQNVTANYDQLLFIETLIYQINGSLAVEINENEAKLDIIDGVVDTILDYLLVNVSFDHDLILEYLNNISFDVSNIELYLNNTILQEINQNEVLLNQILFNTTNIWDQLIVLEQNISTNYDQLLLLESLIRDINQTLVIEINENEQYLININDTVTTILNNILTVINPSLNNIENNISDMQIDLDIIINQTDTLEEGQTQILNNLTLINNNILNLQSNFTDIINDIDNLGTKIDTLNLTMLDRFNQTFVNQNSILNLLNQIENKLDCNNTVNIVCDKLNSMNDTINNIQTDTTNILSFLTVNISLSLFNIENKLTEMNLTIEEILILLQNQGKFPSEVDLFIDGKNYNVERSAGEVNISALLVAPTTSNVPLQLFINDSLNISGTNFINITHIFFQGEYIIKAYYPGDGNYTPTTDIYTLTITTNNTPPIVNIIQPSDGSTINLPYNITFSVVDDNDDNVSIYLFQNGLLNTTIITDLSNTDNFYYYINSTESGTYQLVVEACELNTLENQCANDTHTIFINLSCVPSWQPSFESCLTNDTQFKSYTDANNCGTSVDLPSDNGTFVACNYCSEDISGPFFEPEVCPITETQLRFYIDNNFTTCCSVTGLGSDCSILTPPFVNQSVNCSFLANQITLDADPDPFLNDRIDVIAELSDTNSTKCWSYVKSEEGVLQTNPQKIDYADSLFFKKKIETREYFQPVQGQVNAYYTDENLLSDKEFILGVTCALDNGTQISGEQYIIPKFKDLSKVTARTVWAVGETNIVVGTILIGIAAFFLLLLVFRR